MAVALLLAMSVAMMASASFAWVTLSRAPEVNGLATTISTNGNLEIALSGTDGAQPDESGVTDGSGLVTSTNLKWGNLINLSDSSYGLDKIVLRPASLNMNKLLTSPVQAVKYGADGRMNGFITEFAYSSYDPELGKFGVPDETKYGVRGVSSVTYEDIKGTQFIVDQVDEINRRYTQASTDYAALYGNNEYMAVVGTLVQIHANVTLGNGDVDCATHMPKLLEMMNALQIVINDIGWVYVEIANLYYYQSLKDITQYEEFTLEDLVSGAIPEDFTKDFVYLQDYLNLYEDTAEAYAGVEAGATKAEKGQTVSWSKDLKKYADILCDFETATIHGYRVDQLVGNESAMLDVYSNRKTCEAVVVQGVIKDADQFIDGAFFVKNGTISVTVTYIINVTATPSIRTAADAPYYLGKEIALAEEAASKGNNYKGDAVAAETYAMAIDLWVRTNVPDSLLILEGEVITREVEQYDANGNLIMTEKLDEAGNVVKDENGEPVMVPLKKTIRVGYQGVNRVWDELDDPNSAASAAIAGLGTSITQGSGSCYIFYPQSMEDRNQCMKLLAAMQIAFVDANGTLLAEAFMDTENSVEESGRIIVPLQMYANDPVEINEDGDVERYYITPLTQNEAKRITALVYLDGSNLSNEDVLAAGSITGQLNLQLGTTEMEMDAMDDSEVMDDYYAIDVTSSKNYTFPEDATQWTYPLKMTIVGMEPSSVKANFISVISSTQGAKQPTFEIFKNPDTGFYEATVEFAGPGNYQLRSVQIDGVDYALKEIVYVTIPGESVSSLIWGDGTSGSTKTVLTAESFYQQPMTLTLKSSKSNANVRAVFVGDNGSNVTVNFTSSNGEEYTGVANFNASGTYTLDFVYINGSPTTLDAELHKTIDISLGLRAQIYLSEPYIYQEEGAARSLVKVPASSTDIVKDYTFTPGVGYYFVYNAEKEITFDIRCYIYNDQDEPITGLENVQINYGQGQSAAYAMNAGLSWDASLGYYTGSFYFQDFGIFEFQNVVIDKINYVTKATSAHTITSISTDPMEYVPSDPQDMVFSLGGGQSARTLSLVLKYASAAKLDITLTNTVTKETQTYTNVTAASTDADKNSVFTVTAPSDGEWTITGARASTVFYKAPGEENGTFYAGGTDPNGWLDLTKLPNWQTDLTSKFITGATVSLTSKETSYAFESQVLEKTFSIPQGDLTLSFLAYDGRPIAEYAQQAGVTLNVTADGAYIWSENTVKVSTSPANVAVTGSGQITQSSPTLALNAANFSIDGVYTATDMTVTINGNEYMITNLPKVTVTWTKPTVKVTGTTPGDENARYYVFPLSERSYVEGDFTSFTDYYASVNLYYPYQEGWTDNEWNYPRCPSVELTMTGIPANFKEATMVFANASSSAYSSEFKFTPTAGATSFVKSAQIGAGFNRADGADAPLLYPAGSQTVGQIKVKDKNDVVYTVALSNSVTINQPDKLIYATFASKSSNNIPLASTPGRVVAKINANGEYEITLPTIDAWTVTGLSSVKLNGSYAQVGDDATRTVHTKTWESGLISRKYTYKKYTETTKTMQASGVQTTWDEVRTLTGWKVGNTVYEPGATITISEQQTITPVISVQKINEGSSNVLSTYYKYEYSGVLATATGQRTKPSGYGDEVSSVSNRDTSANPTITPA